MDLLDTVNLGVDRPMDASMDTVDVATAAQRLGVPVATVYKRIQRGRLQVERVDGHVYVILDRPTPSMDPPSNGHGPASTPSMAHPSPPAFPENAPAAPLVAHLESEVLFLRGELAARQHQLEQDAQERAELHHALERQQEQHAAAVAAWQERLREAHVLLAQRPALPAPTPIFRNAEDAPPRPWWARWLWWRR